MQLQHHPRRSIASAHTYWRALCRPPDPENETARTRQRPGRILKTHYPNCNYIHLPKKSQGQLVDLRRHLIAGQARGNLSAGFVERMYREFPELSGGASNAQIGW